MLLPAFLSWACVAVVVASPPTRYTQLEKRQKLPHGWRKHTRLDADHPLPIRIALAQSNLHKGYDHLMDVSHPDSRNYGKHWSAQQVAEAFAPKQETVDSVLEWLKGSGISEARISRSQSLGWLNIDSTVGEAEALLKTKYHLHRHSSGKPQVACDTYHVPQHLKRHIDFITPTVHFDTKVAQAIEKENGDPVTAAAGVPVQYKAALEVTKPRNGFLPKPGPAVVVEDVVGDLSQCNTAITPDCLRALYRVPVGSSNSPGNSLGVVA